MKRKIVKESKSSTNASNSTQLKKIILISISILIILILLCIAFLQIQRETSNDQSQLFLSIHSEKIDENNWTLNCTGGSLVASRVQVVIIDPETGNFTMKSPLLNGTKDNPDFS